MSKVFIPKEELKKLLLKEFGSTEYVDESLDYVFEVIDKLPTILVEADSIN